MRKIEAKMLDAIESVKDWSGSNTSVTFNSKKDEACVHLHSNLIAQIKFWNNSICIKDAGWTSNTTKSRLNALTAFYGLPGIYQKNWEWFLETGAEWEGWAEFPLPSGEVDSYTRKYYKAHL